MSDKIATNYIVFEKSQISIINKWNSSSPKNNITSLP
jgi:hypothetical protein